MTAITGTIKDSGGVALSGRLRVTLDAPLIDSTTTPDTVYVAEPRDFTITSGAVSLALLESETSNVTYHFEFYSSESVTRYYLQDGGLYSGPKVLHTDSRWYTGQTYTVDSLLLSEQAETIETLVSDFRAIVPNQASVDYAQLLPTGIAKDTLDTAIQRLAEILTTNLDYAQALRGGPRSRGTYNAATYYELDDMVELDGSSYIYINETPTAGNQPPNATYWQLLAARGATGTGTAGNDTAYNEAAWNGQTDAPSRNAVRDVIETLAKQSDIAGLAPLASPTFTGNPARSTAPAFGNRTSQLATTQWVGNEFATLASPTFTGNPSAPTQAVSDRSNKIATTDFVADYFEGNNLGGVFYATRTGTSQTLLSNNTVALIFPSEVDPNGQYNNSTGNFTVPTTGTYRVSISLFLDSSGGSYGWVEIGLWNVSSTTRIAVFFYDPALNRTQYIFSAFVDVSLTAGTNYGVRASLGAGPSSPVVSGSSGVVNSLSVSRLVFS
jgi:hypothetical protein